MTPNTAQSEARKAVLDGIESEAERCERMAGESLSAEVRDGLLAVAREWRRAHYIVGSVTDDT